MSKFISAIKAKRQKKEENNSKKEIQSEPKKGNLVLRIIRGFFRWVYYLRSIFFAIPVVLGALYLASYNMENLPEQVGIDLQATGEYAFMISREMAVMAPLAVTGACLVLMIFSRRMIYPWLISIFTLVLPVLLLITNIFPA